MKPGGNGILNLFYEEPDGDRWLVFDRYPRRIVRRIAHGARHIGGQRRVFLNLCLGLDRLGIRYRINDYRWLRRNPSALACVVGKPFVLDRIGSTNPILFGAAVFSHPVDDPDLFERLRVCRVLVPGPWMKEMWRPHWDEKVAIWPVGIDTEHWAPTAASRKSLDVLIYDKLRWDRASDEALLLDPIRRALRSAGRSFREIRYGHYREEEFRAALAQSRAMIFLCEHETQGIAYQQALACDVPILAWDSGGYWRDPEYFPHRVKFQPVTSVPYWDQRCGVKFAAVADFPEAWDAFRAGLSAGDFRPREYILETLTVERSAAQYLRHVSSISDHPPPSAAA